MSGQPRQKILPFFLPMEACPHRCIYCDQYAITGESSAPQPGQVEAALEDFPGEDGAELAFYGGSFTCLPEEQQRAYLLAGKKALAEGKIAGIRISTRPDAVGKERCAFLKELGVRTVELGIQSFAGPVLRACGRGYDSETAWEACLRLKKWGFLLGIQLMTGLPEDRDEWARESLRRSLSLEPALLRIYPTLVLEHTALARLYREGKYQPQGLEEAVSLCADLLAMAKAAGRVVQRIGLNPSAELEASLLAGAYHPAFGGLVREKLRLEQAKALLGQYTAGLPGRLRFPKQELPLLWGQKRAGLLELQRDHPLLELCPEAGMAAGLLLLEQGEQRWELSELEYCRSRAATLERMDKDAKREDTRRPGAKE